MLEAESRTKASMLLLFAVAAAWFLAAVSWGLPVETATASAPLWGPDELGPWGAINVVNALRGGDLSLSPQYPLGQYFVDALLVWPYQFALRLADNVGFPEQTASMAELVLVHRIPSVLMAAGTVVLAALFVRRQTGSMAAAAVTALGVAAIGPLVFYGRTGNVDAAGLFWAMLVLLLSAEAIRDGLSVRRAVGIGLCAAMGIAAKDQQYAFFAGVALVLLVAHLRRDDAAGRPSWKPLLVGLAASVVAYALVSGLLLFPDWFAQHVSFIREGSGAPDELRARIGFYFTYPATPAGYARLVVEMIVQIAAAIGLPLLVLGVAGGVVLHGRDRWLLALLAIPIVVFVLGVLVPVRFVLPRFLLPVDLVLCLLAGIALAHALRSARWRTPVAVLATVGMLWSAVRALDLTWQMRHDARYEAGEWLARNLGAGDTLGFYGARLKLPSLPREVVAVPAPHQYMGSEIYDGGVPASPEPSWLIVIPQQHSERVHEWTMPDSIFAGLMDGSLGYAQVLAIQTPALFPRPLRVASYVNPPVRVFARHDVVPRLAGAIRVDLEPRAVTTDASAR